jgi:hypothetical protein
MIGRAWLGPTPLTSTPTSNRSRSAALFGAVTSISSRTVTGTATLKDSARLPVAVTVVAAKKAPSIWSLEASSGSAAVISTASAGSVASGSSAGGSASNMPGASSRASRIAAALFARGIGLSIAMGTICLMFIR